ncbi:MAG TPA: adenylyltransferase/cytidyltransferase family protein, partial [Tepidisphaeraceae bacterium]|nr:adenylyltransferase/cytidyltransferase family protein [Tepidisphaeraceae bacterium]
MEILHGIDGLRKLPQGAIISIGNFDGIHLGHQRILQAALNLASKQAPLAVVTFEPHPLTVLRPKLAPPRLTLPKRKAELLAEAGVDHLVILPPEPAVLNLTAEQF